MLLTDESILLCVCRDRSDTAVVGSSRPVCKQNNSTLTSLSLTSLFLPLCLALVTFLKNILSVMTNLCVSSVHCVLATFVLRSQPPCYLMSFWESFLKLQHLK